MIGLLFWTFMIWAVEAPQYEAAIEEKAIPSEAQPKADQKSFFEVINQKSQEIFKYLRLSKDELFQKQNELKKNFEEKFKAEVAEIKKRDPKADVESLRKAASEKRRSLLNELQVEKKSLDKNLTEFKTKFDQFVKNKKEQFQIEMKKISAKVSEAQKIAPAESEIQKEFREIPKTPGIVLSPGN